LHGRAERRGVIRSGYVDAVAGEVDVAPAQRTQLSCPQNGELERREDPGGRARIPFARAGASRSAAAKERLYLFGAVEPDRRRLGRGDLLVTICRLITVDLDIQHDARNSSFKSRGCRLMTVLLPPPLPVREDPEALIEEARRRTRRRRRRAATGAVMLVGVAALALVASSGGGSGIVAETSAQPFVSVRAFSREGELAFISRGALWVLDGAAASLRVVASSTFTKGSRSVAEHGHAPQTSTSGPAVPGSPTFSHDGRWLAYLVTAQTADGGPSQLWIANADGTGAHEVAKLAVDQFVGWSPTADVLAVIAEAKGWYLNERQGQLPVELKLVSAGGVTRRLGALSTSPTRPGQIENAVWSPDGSNIAVSVTDPLPGVANTVSAYPVGGGKPTMWFRIRNTQTLPRVCSSSCGGRGVIADLAGWWPRRGIAFWAYCCGATRNLDNTPLEVLTVPGARPRLIAQTLSDGVTDAVAGGPGGSLAVVDSTALGRALGQEKVVEHCSPRTLRCVPVPAGSIWTGPFRQPCTKALQCTIAHPASGTPGSGVSLDPAWSPTAPLLAYVKAPYALTGGGPTIAWYTAHQLYLWNERTGTTRMVATVTGVSVPTWSRNGRDLLYVSGDGLWLAAASGGRPVEIEHPLFPERQWSNGAGPSGAISYFGQIHWTGQFSWWSP
jgi:WD40-like Beta Propeller Repeat